MKVRLFFAWYDFYWSKKDNNLYICLFPCVVLQINLKFKTN
jgi:hypothetical protein